MTTKLKKFTIDDIRSWAPCYDPSKYLEEKWSGTVLDIFDLKACSFEDRLWVILRNDLVSEKLMRLFAVWCARQVQHLMKDERSIKALDVAEAFANGLTTKKELAAAWAAASDTACDAASDTAWAAARYAASDTACDAARDAARAAAWAAARYAARDAQENKLREMLLMGIETGDVK